MGDFSQIIRDIPVFLKEYEWGDRVYNEPLWMMRERIALSLDAMTHLILDDSIGTRWLEHYEQHSPFFLQMNPHPWKSYYQEWGRGIWIQDLGILQHQPAYDALREVWLHDNKKGISWTALGALAKLQDERTIDDIALRLKQAEVHDGYDTMYKYLTALENFKTDKAVDVIMDLADVLRFLHKGKNVNGETWADRTYNLTPVSDDLRSVMFTLHHIGTEKSQKALLEIVGWFPRDGMIYNAYKDLNYSRPQEDQKPPKLHLPQGYDEKLVGEDARADFQFEYF